MALTSRSIILVLLVVLLLFASQAHAFGAGNIASISAIEGKNWRHGDIEDTLKQLACIRHHKWTSMMIKRVYFGNWLRDYSQAMDTGALKKAQPETIRILVWLLSFVGFGYATAEFEVTSERLGVYRPEEHIDNPKDYNDNEDARKFDARLRAPVRPVELEIDMQTGMKNYIANGKGDWATSAAFVKYSFERSIHFGRLYANGHGLFKGKDEDLAEALRYLGQGLHTLEDFGAHTNYVELALIELGFPNVFAHTGSATGIDLRGKRVWPLVTGTFGMVDFYHSVLGEATDHFTQSEVNEMDNALGTAQAAAHSSNPLMTLIKLLSKVPGTRELCLEAEQLSRASQAQAFSSAGSGGWGGQGGWRSVDDPSVGGWDSTRASQPDWSGPQVVNPQQPQAYGVDSFNQPPQPQWGQHQPQVNQPPQPQWGQQQPQFNQPQQPQSFNLQPPSQDQYPGQGAQSQGFGGQQSFGGQHGQDQATAQPQHQQASNPQMPQDQFPVQSQGPQQPQTGVTPQATPSAPLQQPSSAPTGLVGMPDFDPVKTLAQIYPILAFRDKVVRTISAIIEKIPGLEALIDRIVETLTVFILSLLAPFVRPILEAIAKTLQAGSSEVVNSSGQHQYEVWSNNNCSDPTHSMLSKDHFSNLLNEPAGRVAAEILKYIAPRVLYAWEHPDVPVPQVMGDVEKIFHHPAIRDEHTEVHKTMFEVVRKWSNSNGGNINTMLTSQAVRGGKNHKGGSNSHIIPPVGYEQYNQQHPNAQSGGMFGQIGGMVSSFTGQGQQQQPQQQQQQQHGGGGAFGGLGNMMSSFTGQGQQQQHSGGGGGLGGLGNMLSGFGGQGQQHQQQQHYGSSGGSGGGLGDVLNIASKLPIPGLHNLNKKVNQFNKYSKFMPGMSRGLDGEDEFAEIGGSRELHQAAEQANYDAHGQADRPRSPSPPPMQPPPGYEMYTRSSQDQESGGEQYPQQYGGEPGGGHQHQQPYGGEQGGQSGGYSGEQGYGGGYGYSRT